MGRRGVARCCGEKPGMILMAPAPCHMSPRASKIQEHASDKTVLLQASSSWGYRRFAGELTSPRHHHSIHSSFPITTPLRPPRKAAGLNTTSSADTKSNTASLWISSRQIWRQWAFPDCEIAPITRGQHASFPGPFPLSIILGT